VIQGALVPKELRMKRKMAVESKKAAKEKKKKKRQNQQGGAAKRSKVRAFVSLSSMVCVFCVLMCKCVCASARAHTPQLPTHPSSL
jgi:Na+/glutamate symporter